MMIIIIICGFVVIVVVIAQNLVGVWLFYFQSCSQAPGFVGQQGWGVWGKQVGSMNEKSQTRGCYNITCICTNQETV